jgi:hypothetical protein
MKNILKSYFPPLLSAALVFLGITLFPALGWVSHSTAFAQDSQPITARKRSVTTNTGENAIHKAARVGDLALLRAKLQSGANADARDNAGRTPLMDAVAAGQVEAARLLLSAGADVNARTQTGLTPLIEAATHGQFEAAQLLVNEGADLNHEERGWGTALKAAERTGHNNIAEMLLKSGARSSGSSVGDTVCVRPWGGDGYCGVVEALDKTKYRLRVTEVVGCNQGCPAKSECSAGRPVGGAEGLTIGDEVNTVSWCLTHTGVKP